MAHIFRSRNPCPLITVREVLTVAHIVNRTIWGFQEEDAHSKDYKCILVQWRLWGPLFMGNTI